MGLLSTCIQGFRYHKKKKKFCGRVRCFRRYVGVIRVLERIRSRVSVSLVMRQIQGQTQGSADFSLHRESILTV